MPRRNYHYGCEQDYKTMTINMECTTPPLAVRIVIALKAVKEDCLGLEKDYL